MSQLKATERPGLQNHYQDTSLILNRSDIDTGLKNDLGGSSGSCSCLDGTLVDSTAADKWSVAFFVL